MKHIDKRLILLELWARLSSQRKKRLGFLLILTISASLAEMISLGAVLPFLGALTAIDEVTTKPIWKFATQIFNLTEPPDILFTVTLAFIVAILVAGFIRISLIWFQTKLAVAIATDFSLQVYEYYLYQPYLNHLHSNSSEILAASQKAKDLVFLAIQPFLQIFASSLILIAVLITLLALEPMMTLAAVSGFSALYIVVTLCTKRFIQMNSRVIATYQGKVNRAVQEGLGGIRNVQIENNQPIYTRLYADALVPLQRANASNQIVITTPRYIIETLSMTLIAGLAYWLWAANYSSGIDISALPTLGLLALGSQRTLPLLQQIYGSYITIKGNEQGIREALALIQPKKQIESNLSNFGLISFKWTITLENVGFRYQPEKAYILRNVNLEIPKGARVGIIGPTGSGKSTLMDMLMGLLSPTEGVFKIDGTILSIENIKSWQKRIAHVPQDVFLIDATVAENIALGLPLNKIDKSRVVQVARMAKIPLDDKRGEFSYYTTVGERGIRLSGGQRQRIGIARALYKQADVLIFDEATSSLDHATEVAVMESIKEIDKSITVFLIAHRLTTLADCDLIIEIKNQTASLKNSRTHD